jgi:anti-anti-sigma regulatory factor
VQYTRPTLAAAPALRRATRTDWERAIVMPRGSLDSETAGDVEHEILRLCDEGFSSIVIDLRALEFTEPAGDRLLRRLGAVTGRYQVTLSVNSRFAAAA